jgi:hypothetical protein
MVDSFILQKIKNIKIKNINFMKKLIVIALTAFILLSCTRDNYITEIVFPDTFTEFYEVRRNQWREGNNVTHGVHYYFEIQENALTRDVWEFGVMQAFLIYDRNGREIISPLPFSDFFVDDDGVRWEEHITVEFTRGRITFILKNDDQKFVRPFFDDYEFMVRFLW